ncbi:MAG TPA: putative 2OG-Fe(II) oxygenase [Caulobacteraceae bacterium]
MNSPIAAPLFARLGQAGALIGEGKAREAANLLRPLVADHPGAAPARLLFGLALRDLGQSAAAEAQLRAALRLDPASGPAAVNLSELLLGLGRAEEALAATTALAALESADLFVLSAHGAALKALGRLAEAIGAYERAVRAAPHSAVAEHNLAGALGDAEFFAQSETATRRAFAKGLDAPETWLVHARAMVGQSRYDEAESAYREALRRRPDHVEALGELAQVIWMRSEDAGLASAPLDKAISGNPGLQALALKRAELLEYAGDAAAAYASLADVVSRPDAEPMIHIEAARLSMRDNPSRALDHARRAVALIPDDRIAQATLCEAHLASGEAGAATAVALDLRRTAPLDQHAIGLLAAAWRLAGDGRYEELYDYQSLVGSWRIDTPQGWPDLAAYLADLSKSLATLHVLRTHPIGQSVRHGSQTSQNLTLSTDPAIAAFFRAVDGPIRRHIAALGPGDDLVRSRIAADYRFAGAWSIRLRPGGFHANHLHPMGWLSSACYIALPSAIRHDRQGWLKFGEPGVATSPALAAEHFIEPEPGLLALFPSYMWHGTVPFAGDEPRLTIAFDVVPA